ncbi:unnamed protein product [Meganyctiphanes norvegica]|uniref:Uncharacterized protein n=1 Tax=Meganyctiphanes norvegica TaxID=48144 RepID=A0AAV2R3E7_MEGNR
MGESTHESAKRQKVSAAQITNAVCEDCGCKWTATLTEVPVTIFIKDLDDYYKKISSNLLEAVEPPMVLCVFRPSDREVWDTEVTLSCVAPRQDSPYHWRINHKHQGPGTTSGCQIIPWRDKILESKNEDSSTEPVLVTVKQEIKEELEEENLEVMDFDPLAEENEIKPDVNPITTVSSESESSNSCHEIFPSTSKQNPSLKRASEDPDDPVEEKKPPIVDPNLVQIVATKSELDRRITAFQKRKREELDVLNVQEFCTSSTSTSRNSCARTCAVVLRNKDSKSHLKLTRVVNEWGPQTCGVDPGSISLVNKENTKLTSESSINQEDLTSKSKSVNEDIIVKEEKEDKSDTCCTLSVGIEERVNNLETHLKITQGGPVPKCVYARLKEAEERLLYLEGLSPEYFGNSKKAQMLQPQKIKKEIQACDGDLTLNDLDMKIFQLKMKLKQKQLNKLCLN